MPRIDRASAAGRCGHVLNRGNARATIFHKDRDDDALLEIMAEATFRVPMRVIAYCLVPNHFHMSLFSQSNGDLSRWMHWLLTTHVRRYLRHYHSSGYVWQGRFKAFPVQADDHLRVVLHYIERNPLRADLVERAELWRWSSLSGARPAPTLDPGPAPRGEGWIEEVNAVMTDAECASIRESIRRDRPLGAELWIRETAGTFGLESSLRDRGRPRRMGGGEPGVSNTLAYPNASDIDQAFLAQGHSYS